jgi:hypothetical protein
MEIIDFRLSDGSFKLCDELIKLCGFDSNTRFEELCNRLNMTPEILINYVVLIKLIEKEENRYKLIIKYLTSYLENINKDTHKNIYENIKQYVNTN